jgi:hypothetical protein
MAKKNPVTIKQLPKKELARRRAQRNREVKARTPKSTTVAKILEVTPGRWMTVEKGKNFAAVHLMVCDGPRRRRWEELDV